MTRDDILIRIKKNICAIAEIDYVCEETYLDSRGIGFNSLQFLTFIVQIEDDFCIEFEDDELSVERYQLVSDVVDAVEKMLMIQKSKINI